MCLSLGLSSSKLVTMTSLRMKTDLFYGIFLLFSVGIRSENILNTTITPVHLVQTPAEVTSPHKAASPAEGEVKNVSTSISFTLFPLNSSDETRAANKMPFVMSGTERPPHTQASSITATAGKHEVNITAETKSEGEKSTESESRTSLKSTALTMTKNAQVSTSGQVPASNKPTDASTVTARNLTTMLPKRTSQAPANTSAFPMATKSQTWTTTFTPITNTTAASTALPVSSKGLTTTTSVKASSTTPVMYSQNITMTESSQSLATTEQLVSIVNATSGSALTNHTKIPENTKNFSKTTESPIKNQSTSGESIHTTASPNMSTAIAEISSTNVSILVTTNATRGGWIPVFTKTSPTNATNPSEETETTQNPQVQSCSSRSVVKQCLIIIASLGAVATIFIISTIILCTKLSSRKYKLNRQQRGTEMMCISSLLPERSNHKPIRSTRQHSPVPNGVLVIHNYDNSDEEAGDNLTLSSFLPENDRYV